MATISAVFSPDPTASIGSSLLGSGGDSGSIFLGKYRLFRIWTDNTSGLSISFGVNGSAPSPTSSAYSIGTVPQDFDLGSALDTIRLVNNSNVSSAHYFIQVLAKS